MNTLSPEIIETIKVWPVVSKLLSTLHTEKQYTKTVKLLDSLIDMVSEKEDFVIESLIDTLGTLIKEYEDRNVPEPKGDLIGYLKYLMNEHHLTPADLTELGNRDDVMHILAEKKQLTVKQIKALNKRFCVSPVVFI